MNHRTWRIAAALAAGATLSIGVALGSAQEQIAPGSTTAKESPAAQKLGEIELADRFEALALSATQNQKPLPPVWREIGALLSAASRLNPAEPRFLRMLYEARFAGKEPDQAVSALRSYLTLCPDDQYAQARLIDLFVSRMQTADAITGYARALVAKTALPAPVRAHAAVICAQTLIDHAERDEASKMLDIALQIEPLNWTALHMKLLLSGDQGPSRRCGLLLALMRSNPLDPQIATELANELAALGMVEEASVWYTQAAGLYNVTGEPRSPDLGRGAATEIYLYGHGSDAAKIVTSYLASVPSDADAWAIRLAIVKDLGRAVGSYDDLARQAVASVTDRLQSVRSQLGAPNAPAPAGSADQPTTPPSDADTQPSPSSGQPPDVSGDTTLLVKANQRELTDAYLSAMGDVAWLRLYFLRDAGSGTRGLLDELARLLPADDPLLARLNGWSYLLQNEYANARLKLSAVADRDPYAALGMVLLDDQAGDKSQADALARSTLATHPSGAAAAVLYSALHGRGAAIVPSAQAGLVKAALAAYPSQWMEIVVHPQSFYNVTIEPLESQVGFLQSILARVTIENIGDFDITVGDDGTLRPDMVFDANARGMVEKQMLAVVYDRFWQRLLLARGQSASQVVRLDRGELSNLLRDQPGVPIDLQLAVTVNPTRTDKGFVVGPAGYTTQTTEIVERASTPMDKPEDRQKLYDQAGDPSPALRLRAIEAMTNFGINLRTLAEKSGPDATTAAAEQTTIAQEIFDHARPLAGDLDPSVKAWANYMAAIAALPDQQPGLIREMAQSDDWRMRLLSLEAAQLLPDHGVVAASALSTDPDPAVMEYASAMTDYVAAQAAAAAAAAATQPSQ